MNLEPGIWNLEWKKCLLACVLVLGSGACVLCGAADLKATQELTSNSIRALAGTGDTVWLVTDRGINAGRIGTGDTIGEWRGYLSRELVWPGNYAALDACGPRAIVSLPAARDPSSNEVPENELLEYHIGRDRVRRFRPGFDRDNLERVSTSSSQLDSIRIQTVFAVSDISAAPDAFWFAAFDGGVVRYDATAEKSTVFYPGVDSSAWAISRFPPRAFEGFPDSTRSVYAVAAAADSVSTTAVWALTPQRIWRLLPADSTWDTLGTVFEESATFLEFAGLFVRGESDNPAVLAAASMLSGSDTAIHLFQYDTAGQWRTVIQEEPLAVTFGQGDTAYVVHDNQIRAYRLRSAGDGRSQAEELIGGSAFQQRILGSGDIAYPEVRDILYVPRTGSAEACFWVGTDNGLFYTGSEHADETDAGAHPFNRARRSRVLAGGLARTYAYPGIMTVDHDAPGGRSKCCFAYNLDEPADVTIRVYDWNMDLVKTIIADERRRPGSERAEGRSTDERYDVWDGTDRLNRRVAAGLYYYKISTSTGKRAFGKIVVAQ